MRIFRNLVAIVIGAAVVAFLATSQRFAPEREEVLASTLNLPYTFSSGQVIYASQINANFQAIRAVINALDDANIAGASITGSTKLIDGTVPLVKLATDSVNSAKIVDSSIVTTDVLDGTLLAADLAVDSVQTAKIVDGAVTEPKIDFANSPAANQYVVWNGTKLEYRNGPGITACTQLWMTTDSMTSFTPTRYFSWIDGVDSTSETNIAAARYPTALPVHFHHLTVQLDAAASGGNMTFSLHAKGGSTTALTCTILSASAQRECMDYTTDFDGTGLGGALDGGWILKVNNTDGVLRNFIATMCMSPF